MADSDPIREGFICPICHKDLRSPNNLIAHFQDQHSEEQDILKSIKDFYGKAKRILKLNEQDLEIYKNELKLNKYQLDYSEPQDPGESRSHTDYFKAVRRNILDHRTSETNKLIIRLDRLLRFYGSERKQQEQELVTWLDGTTVTRCPSCAASFNLTRRQHHCRLCGSIMCNGCSYFLPYEMAQTIIAPVHNLDANAGEHVSAKDSDSLRICIHCLGMLETRRRVQIEQMKQPIICQLYSHLQKLKKQVQNSVELYQKMYNSLMSGETTFQLQDTQSLRSTIARDAEMIDILSKKIAHLPVPEHFPKEAQLQNSIHRATSHYIKNDLLNLPVPPTVSELEEIRKRSLLRSTQEEEEESQLKRKARVKKVTVTTGWSPANVPVKENTHNEDPLIEQMNIVRNFIDQARQAQRFEEVAALEENLRVLKRAYKKQPLQNSI